MIYGIGTDICDVRRIRTSLERHGDRFARKILSDGELAHGYFMQPTIITGVDNSDEVVQTETFAPILYIMPFDTVDEAIAIQNGVPQGLSSSIFTTDLRDAERFLSAAGSDCGIANVNIGPSGAEIGGDTPEQFQAFTLLGLSVYLGQSVLEGGAPKSTSSGRIFWKRLPMTRMVLSRTMANSVPTRTWRPM